MDMMVESLAEGVNRVFFVGDLDMEGAGKVDLAFAALAGTSTRILVDLSRVDLLALIGIRTLVLNAQVINRRGGKMIALNPQPMVENALRKSGTDQLIPIFNDADTAIAALRA